MAAPFFESIIGCGRGDPSTRLRRPGLILATSIDVAPHCGDHLFRLTSEPMRFPPPEVIGSSPRSPLKTIHWIVFLAFRTPALMIYLPATSMVMAPHWGDHSLSVDLRIDEIPSTGGHRFFAHWQSSELRPLARFPGAPNPRMTLYKENGGKTARSAVFLNELLNSAAVQYELSAKRPI